MINSPIRAVYLLLFFIILIVIAWNKPKENYDTVFYVASALSWQQQDPAALQKQTYAELKLQLSDEGYRALTESSKPSNAHYRSTVFEDTEAFRQQLPYYQPRVIYSGVLFILSKLGLDIIVAMKIISLSAMVLGLLVLLAIFRDQRIYAPLFYLAPWLICSLGYFDLARYYGPDVIAFLLVACCYRYLLTAPSKVMWLLPLLVLVRTDLIVLVGILSIYLYKTGQKPWHITLMLLCTGAILKLLQQLFGGYSWGTTILFTFVDLNPFPETMNPTFTLWTYMDLWLQEVKETVLTDDRFLAFLLLALFPAWSGLKVLLKPSHNLEQKEQRALLALLGTAYVFAHILLFPASWERFFMAQYIWVFLLTLAAISTLWRKPQRADCSMPVNAGHSLNSASTVHTRSVN